MSASAIAALDTTQMYPNIQDFCTYIFDELLQSKEWEAIPTSEYSA